MMWMKPKRQNEHGNKTRRKVRILLSRSKSILLQVAFKEAVDVNNNIDDIAALTIQYYELLTKLHEELGIDLEDRPRGRSGGNSKPKTQSRELPTGAMPFNVDGEQWIDYRKAKDQGSVVAKHPDFKSFDFKQAVWMVSQEGDPNEEAERLVKEADKYAAL